ncbi:S8 family serine peptidase (plasmid) [Deinococcus sp. KNUC1210]|uniref:S8 family serine peptidase n=1 Tax=Deinococcus sp. KNUC1210 TaxID=2917691 RepID=UPI001EF00CD7|nr:S8 family serine peptidase [Deinococcus sp. KNUC1210]ULH17628.1 S8 family serine peptidase [Deinococcus sp. KNUC1210]
MKHAHALSYSLVSVGLALTLAACGQGNSTVPSSPAASQTGSTVQGTPVAADAYLVGFRQPSETLNAQGVSTLSVAAQAVAVESAGGQISAQYAELSALAVRLTPAALARLKADPNVEYVEPDYERHALGFRSGGSDTGVGLKSSSGISAQAVSAQAVRWTASGETTWGDTALRVPTLRGAGYTGTGVAVCVGDTGIDGNHPEFQGKLKGYRNFTSDANRTSAYSLNDVSHHGTHVSGTIFAQYGAGTGASGLQSGEDPNGVGGVASGVNLYMARVLGDSGTGSSSQIINGVNWCAGQLKSKGGSEAHVVISLSLGGGGKSQTEQRAYTAAYNAGALIVAATGNDGAAVSYPAAYTNVLAVGAIDDSGTVASFSNFGSKVALVGPGVHVLSSVPLGQGSAATASAVGVPAFTEVSGGDKSGKGTFTGNIVLAGGTNNEFCGTTTRNAALSGNIALISRGTCTFEEKIANAAASGAKAVMIYNNVAGPLGGMAMTNTYTIPVVGLSQSDGQATLAKLPTSGTASVTSADYEYFDGTSMATPHVSAAAAVVWAAKPTLTPTQLTSLLTSTATDLGAAGKDDSYGYGLVNPYKAITGN